MGTTTPVAVVCLTVGVVIITPHPHTRHVAAYRTWGQNEGYSRCPQFRAQELCESRDERPGLPVPNMPNYGLCGRNAASSNNLNSCPEFRSSGAVSVKVEADVLGSPSLIVRTVSVDAKQH